MKKGYTLIELLAVILIVALISVLALTAIVKKTNQFKEISNQKAKELILSSAKSYLYNNKVLKQDIKNAGSGVIQYKTLKNSNYLNDKLIDLKTYEEIDINNSCVCVKYENYKYTFSISQPCNCN